MQLKTFADINRRLRQFMPAAKDYNQARFSLDDMKRLLDYLGNPQEKFRVVHVAGTSGKTSTSYYTAALLKAAGCKVGLTVSPHIDEVNERVQINLQPISEQMFATEFATFLQEIEVSDSRPSYFGVLVAFAYWLFAKEQVDYAVIEVGMGGLLDATNAVTRPDKVCVITDIGLDHTEYLGTTLAAITSQKAGIIHPGNHVFMHDQPAEVMTTVSQICIEKNATLHKVATKSHMQAHDIPLFQQHNWQLAHEVFAYVAQRDGLKLPDSAALAQTAHTYVPGRMEVLQLPGKTIIMDAAHNAHKLGALAKSIAAAYPGKSVAALYGVAQTKGDRAETSVDVITQLAQHLILTTFDVAQDVPKVSVPPEQIATLCQTHGYKNYEIEPDALRAWQRLLDRPEDILLVTGSIFLLDTLRPFILKNYDKTHRSHR